MKVILSVCLTFVLAFAEAQPRIENAELFIQIEQPGFYTVRADDEIVGSASGKFRFFDIPAGRVLVTISRQNRLILRKEVSVRPGLRTLAIYTSRSGLRVFDELPIYNSGSYWLDNWSGNRYSPGRPEHHDRGHSDNRLIRPEEFSLLKESVKKENFDEGRLRLLNLALRNNRISVNQLLQLLKEIRFDDNLLTAAINSYPSVQDRQNFYQVRNLMKFSDTKEKFDSFLLRQ